MISKMATITYLRITSTFDVGFDLKYKIVLVRVKRHTKIKKKQRLGWHMPSQHKNGSSMLYYQSVY
jgi:hypothetical protein